MYGLTRLHDARFDLGEQGNHLQKTQSCPMSADTQEFARHAAQIHLNAGTEAALTELLRDLVQNCGSSHGQLTLAPYQKGWVVFPANSTCRGAVTARGRFHHVGSRERLDADKCLRDSASTSEMWYYLDLGLALTRAIFASRSVVLVGSIFHSCVGFQEMKKMMTTEFAHSLT